MHRWTAAIVAAGIGLAASFFLFWQFQLPPQADFGAASLFFGLLVLFPSLFAIAFFLALTELAMAKFRIAPAFLLVAWVLIAVSTAVMLRVMAGGHLAHGNSLYSPLAMPARFLSCAIACALYLGLTSLRSEAGAVAPLWQRVLAGVVAFVAGVAAALGSAYLSFGGASQRDSAGWTAIFSIFFLPIALVCAAAAIGLSELMARWVPRMLLLVIAALPGVLFLVAAGGVETLGNEGIMFAMFGPWSFMPASVAGFLYLLLSMPGMGAPRVAPPVAATATPKPPPQPTIFTPVVLEKPPSNERLWQIALWPEERISQAHFLYALQLWGVASAIWFPLPFMLGKLLGFDHDAQLMLAALGWFALFWSAFCLLANRLHDIGASALLGVAPVLIALAWVISEGSPEKGWFSQTTLIHWIVATGIVYAGAAALLLPLKSGDAPSRFGSRS